MTPLTTIPGIGKTFAIDFRRIGIESVEQLTGRDPDAMFEELAEANAVEAHATSKNYLYVIRMAVYYANGGREPAKLKWNAWKDV